MRNMILYFFIMTSFIFAQTEVIKPFLSLSEEGEEILDKELNLNLNSSILGHYHTFKMATFTTNKKYLIALTQNNTYNTKYNKLIFFNTKSKKLLYVFDNKKDNEEFTYIKVIDSYLYTVNKKGFIKKWKINIYEDSISIELLPAPFLDTNFGRVDKIFSTDNNIIIYYSTEKSNKMQIMVSDLNTSHISFLSNPKIELNEYNISKKFLEMNKYFIENNYLISVGNQGKIILSSINKSNINVLHTYLDKFESFSVTNDGKLLIIVDKHKISIYDIFSNQLVATYRDKPVIESIVFTKDNRYLITATNTGYIHIWDLNTSQLYSIIKVHEDRVTSLDISDNGKYLATGSTDKTIKIWDIHDINNILLKNMKKVNKKVSLIFFNNKGVTYQRFYHLNGVLEKGMKYIDFNLSYKNNINFFNYEMDNINHIKIDEEMKKIVHEKNLYSIDKSSQYIMYGKKGGKVGLIDLMNHRNDINLKRMNTDVILVKISHNNQIFISVDINGNIYIHNKYHKNIKILKANDDGNWFRIDSLKKKIYRGDDGFLFLESDKNGIFHYKNIEEKISNIELKFPQNINIERGKISVIPIEIKENLKISHANIEIFLNHSDFTLIPNDTLITGRSKNLDISLLYNNDKSAKNRYRLKFRVKVNSQYLEKIYKVSIHIRKPIIDISKITINDDTEDKEVKIHFKNSGDANISMLFWNRIPSKIKSLNANSDVSKRILDDEDIVRGSKLSLYLFNPNPPYQSWYFHKDVMYKPKLKMDDVVCEDKKVNVIITNSGNMDLNKSLVILMDKNFKEISRINNVNLKKGENEIDFIFYMKPHYTVGERVHFNARVIYKELSWKLDKIGRVTKSLPEQRSSYEMYLLIFLLFIIIFFVFWKLYIFKEKYIEEILENVNNLFKVSPLQLKKTVFRLKRAGKIEEVLEELAIDKEKVSYVIDFIENGFSIKNKDYFSSKAKVEIESVPDIKNFYRLRLKEDFSLNLQSFYLYLKLDKDELGLKTSKINEKTTIVISNSHKSQEEVQQFKNNALKENSLINNKLIVLTMEDVMKLLLAKDYIKALERVFANYIEPKYISPFNTRLSQYEYKDREKANIVFNLNKRIKSHFIIGPKGAGKTYLLSLIHQSLDKEKNIDIYTIEKRTSENIVEYVQKKIKSLDDKCQLVFLVDNVDYFIKNEKEYKIVLNYFKEMNSRKNVCFIMTGFWELYEELNIKERSPLQNFAEVKEITDKIDNETAKKMINSSMSLVNVAFEDSSIVDEIINNSGGKINLINLICQELLNILEEKERIIVHSNLQDVLQQKRFIDELERLKNIDDKLEQIIVHLMAGKERFSSKDLVKELDEHGIEVTTKKRECHLKKLLLQDILIHENEYFIFRIPILQNMFKAEQKKLTDEIKEFNSFVPVINTIKAEPNELYSIPYLHLSKIYKQLEKTQLIDMVVNELKIEKRSLQIVKDAFASRNKFDRIIAQFVERLDCTYIKEKDYYTIRELKNFPLNMKEFIIHFTLDKNYGLIQNKFTTSKVVLIINLSSIETQNEFYRKTLDKVNKFIAPKSDEITKLFLSPTPEELLLEILSRHLSLRNISPYQISKGVENESIFFGREKIITDIIQREPRNYLIVGARRVGKSSLLKALQRKNLENSNIESYYFTLSDTNLENKIIEELKLKNHNIDNFLDLKNYLKQQNKKYIFLIDEVDDFIEEDKTNNYKFLKILREMSEEGYVSFILAGFWQLYKSKYEHQSPLLNFGDWIEIAELEEEACYDLITKPMSIMNIEFENREIVKKIMMSTGQKAQLISLVCQELLERKNKKNISSLITSSDVSIALNSNAMRDELGKWIELKDKKNSSSNKKGEFLRQIIVYGMLDKNKFTTKYVQNFLRKQDIDIDLSDVEYHLELLVLSFFLKQVNSNPLSFRVPKQREFLQEDDVEFKIEENIYSFKRNSK